MAIDTILLLLAGIFTMRLHYLIGAGFEVYNYICTNSLYEEFLTSFPEDCVNTTENTVIRCEQGQSAPPYDSVHKPDQEAGAYPKHNP